MGTDESSFTIWIKQRRRALDLTQEDLSECVGCSTTTIQKIELGQRRPSKQMALRLAECLRLPSDEHEEFVRFARGDVVSPGAGQPATGENASSALLHRPEGTRPEQPGRANPNNLPTPLTLLLGRGEAVAAASDYLLREDIRLLTFTGAPGIGKTRLSIQVGKDLLPHFRDGVCFVELAPVTDPSLVASTIASTLGLAESSIESTQSDLSRFFSGKRMVLVLDNFEQVLDAAPLVVDLLSSSPRLKVLITSREALHVPGEQQFPLFPLDLPDMAHMPEVKVLPDYPAIALFLERARAVDPTFALNEQNAFDVTTVCSRLDGLPLAIELAAARVTLFSMSEMSARLGEQLNLLASPARYRQSGHLQHLPARQQTMRGAIAWSYQLLEEDEQQLLCRLGVFMGGWTLEAAEAVCGADAADGMESLLAKSLLQRVAVHNGGKEWERRFTMLESIREYALQGLEASGEIEETRRRHSLYFLDLAERAEAQLTGEDQTEWYQRLEREHSNLVAAMSWSLARREDDIALRFGGALKIFWYDRHWMDGRLWLAGVLEGALKGRAGETSITHAKALLTAAEVLRKTREYRQARVLFEEALGIYRALDDRLNIGVTLRRLAIVISEMKLPDEKELVGKLYEESLTHFHSIGFARGIGLILNSLGEVAREERDYPQAIDAFEKSLANSREVKDKQNIASGAGNLAFVLYHCGDYDRAKELFGEALRLFQEVASAFQASWILFGWAGIERAQGEPHKAARLIAAASVLAAASGTLYDPNDQRDREEIEAAVRADLSEQDWQSAQEWGRTMGMDDAITYAFKEGETGNKGHIP